MLNSSDWPETAKKIHYQIYQLASTESVRIGFINTSSIDKAISELRRFGIKKPFLKDKKSWLRRIVVENKEAFVLLSPNIRLEFIIDGQIAYWKGYGACLDYKAMLDFAEKAGDWVLEKQSPVWVSINLGNNASYFCGLLEDLDENGHVKKV